MNGIKSVPIVASVTRREDFVTREDSEAPGGANGADGARIPIRIYTPAGVRKSDPQPVFYYIHGGGFVAGSMDVVEEMCKLVVEKTGCAAVQVGYRLAPENPYPAGVDDCYAVLQWIYENDRIVGGDPERNLHRRRQRRR